MSITSSIDIYRINRIRLEFKDERRICGRFGYDSINRIRLEFKGNIEAVKIRFSRVLIESDWNLKLFNFFDMFECSGSY